MTDTTVQFKEPLSQNDISRMGGAASGRPYLLRDPLTGNIQMKKNPEDKQALLEFSGANGKFSTLEIHMPRENFAAMMLQLKAQGDKELYRKLERAVAGTDLMPNAKELLYEKADALLNGNHLDTVLDAQAKKVMSAIEELHDYMDTHGIKRDEDLENNPKKLAELASKLPKNLVLAVKRAMEDMPPELLAATNIHASEELRSNDDPAVAAPDEQKLLHSIGSNADITAMMATNKEFAKSVTKLLAEIRKPGDQSHSPTVERELLIQAQLFKKATGETLQR